MLVTWNQVQNVCFVTSHVYLTISNVLWFVYGIQLIKTGFSGERVKKNSKLTCFVIRKWYKFIIRRNSTLKCRWQRHSVSTFLTKKCLVHITTNKHQVFLHAYRWKDKTAFLWNPPRNYVLLLLSVMLIYSYSPRARILVEVTLYCRLLIGRDGHLDQSEAYDIL